MIPVQGWILIALFTIITIFLVYWDTSRRYKQQIEQNKNPKNAEPYFPTWSWARMNTQYILCLINIWISITMYHLKVFSIFLSIFLILLFLDMQFMSYRTNATYLVWSFIIII